MDTFFEQLISIRKNAKSILSIIGIWIIALMLAFLILLFGTFLAPFTYIIVLAVFYGAFKLSVKFNIEYEYIVTNGIMDIDKIINKSSRKRIVSFDLKGVTSIEKFNPSASIRTEGATFVAACNHDHPDAYLMVVSSESKGTYNIVFAPNERMREAIVKCVPRYIANSAFK